MAPIFIGSQYGSTRPAAVSVRVGRSRTEPLPVFLRGDEHTDHPFKAIGSRAFIIPSQKSYSSCIGVLASNSRSAVLRDKVKGMRKWIGRLMPKLFGRTQEVRHPSRERWDLQTLIGHEAEELQSIPNLMCNTENLLPVSEVRMEEIFGSQKTEREWDTTKRTIQIFEVSDGTGGVNPGDRRAIYYLISHFKPRSVLEIGTHIGASMIHVAAALHKLQESENNGQVSLVSVDVTNVNDAVLKPWLNYGTKYSPIEIDVIRNKVFRSSAQGTFAITHAQIMTTCCCFHETI